MEQCDRIANPHPNGLETQNPNPEEADFSWLHHIPKHDTVTRHNLHYSPVHSSCVLACESVPEVDEPFPGPAGVVSSTWAEQPFLPDCYCRQPAVIIHATELEHTAVKTTAGHGCSIKWYMGQTDTISLHNPATSNSSTVNKQQLLLLHHLTASFPGHPG